MRKILWISAVLFIACAASAQSFTVFDIDTSNFPIMRAKFYAFDAAGVQQSPLAAQIGVKEDGVERPNLSVSCPPVVPPEALSSVLVMDVSGSMASGNIDIAKAAANAWVERLPLGGSECALSSFDHANYFNQDFTTNRARLLSAIEQLGASGGTDYDKGLLLEPAGGLQVTKRAKYKRVIVFLSDGICTEAKVSEIIDEARKQNCTIFTVIVGLECPAILKEISLATRGRWFERITTSKQVADIYQQILSEVQGGLPCELTWSSGATCIEGLTNVQFTWSDAHTNRTYQKPSSAVVRGDVLPRSLYFFSKPISQRFDTTVSFKAINADIAVTNISCSNPLYDVNPKSFSLAKGESQQLTISFTPLDSMYSWTNIVITSDVCEYQYYASGGYPRQKLQRSVKMEYPNGGEELVAGSEVVVTWSGIPLSDTVLLAYSINRGQSWTKLTNKASGGKYVWRVPRTASSECLMAVFQRGFGGNGGWLKQGASTNLGQCFGDEVVTDAYGNSFVTGDFSSTMTLDGIILSSFGDYDMFVVKYRQNGTVEWVRTAGGTSTDHGSSLTVDGDGNVYVIGSFIGSANFDGVTITGDPTHLDIFIAKYAPNGDLVWVRKAGGTGIDVGMDISHDIDGNIYIIGWFEDVASFEGNLISTSGGTDLFTAKYDRDGNVQWVRAFGSRSQDYGLGIAVDRSRNVFIAGKIHLADSVVFGSKVIKRKLGPLDGDPMFILAKYRSNGSEDWLITGNEQVSSEGWKIALDSIGNIYLAGRFEDSLDLGSTRLDGGGVFVSKYDQNAILHWARRCGREGDFAKGICSDAVGNTYVTGYLTGSGEFGGDTLNIDGFQNDIFLAQFSPSGNLNKAERAGGRGLDGGEGVAVDPLGNIVTTGGFHETANFRGDTLSCFDGTDMFTWKIGDDILQSDTSDGLFSIVMPAPLSHDIDMGTVVVGNMKDSVISAFVSNNGSYQFGVDSIGIIGSSEFQIVSGMPPFSVPAKAAHPVEFRFQPSLAELNSAQIMIVTQADTLYQTITGTGIQPIISTIGTVIDFGTVETTDFKDTTISLAVTNTGPLPIDFTSDTQLGPDKIQFSLLSGGGAFTLQPNESREVSIRFAPRFIGRTSGRIGFNYNGPGSPAILQLFGQGLGGLVKIADDSAYPGEKWNIAMELVGTPSSTLQSLATGFRARVAYNSTVLAPFGGNVARGSGVDTVTVEGALNTDNSLTSMPFLAALGNADVSSMDLVEFVWLDAQGQPANYDVETESGTFKLLGVCEEGGKRLFNPDGQVAITRISPNPASESMQVEIETIEAGRTQVLVMDVLGRTIATLYDGEIASGSHKLNLNTSQIAAGSYYVSLVTPTVKRFARVDVAR